MVVSIVPREHGEVSKSDIAIPGKITPPTVFTEILTKDGEVYKGYRAVSVVVNGFTGEKNTVQFLTLDCCLNGEVSDDGRTTSDVEIIEPAVGMIKSYCR